MSALAKLTALVAFLIVEIRLALQVGEWQEGYVLGWTVVLSGAYVFGLFFLLGYLSGKDSSDA
jgi:hypothetical protein